APGGHGGHAAGLGRADTGPRPHGVHDGGRDRADQPARRPRFAVAGPPPAPALAAGLAGLFFLAGFLTSSSDACRAASRSGAAGASLSTARLTPSPLSLALIPPISRSRYSSWYLSGSNVPWYWPISCMAISSWRLSTLPPSGAM